jgi:hypothetical protein
LIFRKDSLRCKDSVTISHENITFTSGDRFNDFPRPVHGNRAGIVLTEFSCGHQAIDATSICGNGEPTLDLVLAEATLR